MGRVPVTGTTVRKLLGTFSTAVAAGAAEWGGGGRASVYAARSHPARRLCRLRGGWRVDRKRCPCEPRCHAAWENCFRPKFGRMLPRKVVLNRQGWLQAQGCPMPAQSARTFTTFRASGSGFGRETDFPIWARKRDLKARIWTILRASGSGSGRGADVRGHDPIRLICTGPRTSISRPKSAPKKMSIVRIRALQAPFLGAQIGLMELRAGGG